MIWTLLWKFKKPLGIVALVIALLLTAKHLIKKHDEAVTLKAKSEEIKRQLGIESDYVNSILQDANDRIDSINIEHAKEIKERSAVQEHKKKLVTLQTMDQSKVDSFVAQVRDSAVEVVVDSLSSLHKVVVARLQDQLIDAGVIETSLNREINRLNSTIELKNTQLDALQNFNERLHADCDPAPPPNGESVGHFIVHKALPVVALGTFITVGVVRTVHELRDK